MKICVIGTGYVGLVGSAVFADWGNEVIGVDNNPDKIKLIESGNMPIFEPGLKELVAKNINNGNLKFTNSLPEGISEAEIIFICVGTPMSDNGSADLKYIYQVAEEIALNMKSPKIISIKSTVPVGTNRKVREFIKSKTAIEFASVSVPEFLREGSSIEDMNKTDRTVIGSDDLEAIEKVSQLFNHLNSPIVKCDLESAELIKYASNSFLATKISFINEIAQICDLSGADVTKVAYGMGLDSRIGPKFLNASIGYGGSCFPKDVLALYKTSEDFGYHFNILDSVMKTNKNQKYYFLNKIKSIYGSSLEGKKVAALGLAFKNDTDDIRESVAIEVIKLLKELGAKVNVFDPEAMPNSQKVLGDENINYLNSKEEVFNDSDFLVILTEWKEFKEISNEYLLKLRDRNIFDGRNLLESSKIKELGINYYSIGRK
jgi:UDPglucose 6-dehydrogenase